MKKVSWMCYGHINGIQRHQYGVKLHPKKI